MLDHGIENLVVSDVQTKQPELRRDRFLSAPSVTRANACTIVQSLQLGTAKRSLQILYDCWFDTTLPKDFKGFAGRPAERIMIDRYVHVTESSYFLRGDMQRARRRCGLIPAPKHCRVAGTMLANRRFLARDMLFAGT